MLPLRDKNPSGIIPWAVYGLIGLNTVVFLFEVSLPRDRLMELAEQFGIVPRQITLALQGKANLLGALVIPTFASMFLHGGWAHLLGNMWFLHIFGDNVEARLGRARFILFYLFCGLAASAAQYVLDPNSPVPIIGASGAIAGVLGAYVVCWPRARVLTLVPFFYFIHFVHLPAYFVLGFWFLIQFFQGAASLGVQFTHGVAYWAHVGGFAAGAVLMYLLPGTRGPRRYERR
ncbi:MAG: rhomboid family intramembrane serine protease [Candidatus Brocadiae bacterium]|nr:rhomboid family intramembrane serine protease [Candidatus Brocadiia bacterium]